MSSTIFYGAGKNAERNYDRWINSGFIPVCFADADLVKQHTLFRGLDVLPLLEAVSRFPDYILYCTQIADSFKYVKNYLLGAGIPEDRIRLIECNQTAKNALIPYKTLLCNAFHSIIDDLVIMGEYKEFKPIMLASDILQCFQVFITQQEKIQAVYDRLDENSKRIWYSLIYLWLVTQLFLEDPHDTLYTRKKRYNDFKLIQNIVPEIWDLDSKEEYSPVKEWYIIDDNFMKQGDFVIDGGAYTGDTAVFFSQIIGDGTVFAFEPFGKSFEELAHKKLPNVKCINKGLYSNDTVLEFSIHDEMLAGNSITNLQYAAKIERLPVTSVDNFVNENGISRIDFIKMDIEGAEIHALNGASETIRRFKPNMAISIYHNYGSDAINVPIYILENFGDLYDFSIKHHSVGWYESIMYAKRK